MDQFLQGKPAVYTDLCGAVMIATYKREDAVAHIDIRTPSGRRLMAPIASESFARNFFWNLDA